MSTQSLVPVGAYWIFTDAMPRSEVAVALSGTVPVSGEPGLVRLTATVLKSAAVAIDAVEYELAVKSAPDAPAPPPRASMSRTMAASRAIPTAAKADAAPDAMRPTRRVRALRVPAIGRPWPYLTPLLRGVEVELRGRVVALVRVVRAAVEGDQNL